MVFSEKVEKIIAVLKGVALGLLFLFVILFCAYSDTHYKRTGWIKTTGTVHVFEFTDTTGNVWEFEDENLLIPNDIPIKCTVKMFTNNTTDYIKDDMIIGYDFKNQK